MIDPASIQIRPLSDDLLDDYLHFFDEKAFPDNPRCFCFAVYFPITTRAGRGSRQRNQAPALADGARKGAKSWGRVGLVLRQAQTLLNAPDVSSKKGLRDRAMLAVLLGCGLRRSEVAALTLKHVQQRDNRWCIVDRIGKHGRVRTIPMPTWVKVAIDAWTAAAGISEGHVLRPINRGDQVQGERMTENAEKLARLLVRNFNDADTQREFVRCCMTPCACGRAPPLHASLAPASIRSPRNASPVPLCAGGDVRRNRGQRHLRVAGD
jgi:integrase